MAGKKIGLVLALDGEREVAAAMQAIQKEANQMKTALNNVSKEFSENANSMEALKAKQEALTNAQNAYQRKVNTAKSGLEAAQRVYEEQSKALEELRKRLTEAKNAQEQMESSGDKSSDAYKKQVEEVAKLEHEYSKQSAATLKASGSMTDWNTKISKSQSELNQCNKALAQNEQYMKEAVSSADYCATSIDKFGKEIKETASEIDDFGKSASSITKVTTSLGDKVGTALVGKGVGVAVDALKAGAEAVKESMYDISKASSQLQASTGLSEAAAKRYKGVMEDIRGNNFGEDYSDIASAMSEVIQIMGELDDSSMKDITESAIALRDTFNFDVNESIRAVDVMMKTMGVDAKTAFDLIVAGAQNGLNRSGELTDNITEYAQLWGQAGFSAEQMFAILENGLDAGAYNLDKVNDYVKEFGNSLADGRIEANLSSFSENTQNLFREWKNGNASTSDVFYSVINDLSEMTNKQKALTLASEVWSALGEDNAMQVLTALDDVNNKYKDVKGSMDSLKEVRYDNLESAVSGLGAAIQENIVAPIADAAIPAVTGFLKVTTDAVNSIGNNISPQKQAMKELAESTEAVKERMSTAIQNADATMESVQMDAVKLDTLGRGLISLNGVEDKSIEQKTRLKIIVEELGQSIPEVAAAYDEEAGKVGLTDAQIKNLITSKKELLATNALEAAEQETMNSLIEAQMQLTKVEMIKEHAEDRLALMEEERQLYEDLYESKAALGEDAGEAFDTAQLELWNKALEDGKITYEEYQEALQFKGADSWSQRAMQMNQDTQELQSNVEELSEEYDKLSESVNQNQEAYDLQAATSEKVIAGFIGEKEALEETTNAFDENGDAVTQTAEEIQAAAESMAQSITASTDTQKEAMQSILDTYNGYVSEIEADLQNTINPFDKFDTSKYSEDFGENLSVEGMTENLESQIEAFENYSKSLEAVKDHVGKEISPEFMKYLEDMGIEGKNTLDHILQTFADEEPEKVKELNDKWVQVMNMTEDMAEVQAANRIAYEALTGELGSSDADFSALRDSIDTAVSSAAEGWEGLPEATEAALEQTIQTAQDCGIKIPEGLAEGISSGETSPEEAIAQLKGSIQGMFEGLSEMAKEAGVDIDEDAMSELAAGIESGGQEAVDAMSQLIQLIAGKNAELKKELEEGTKTDGTKASVKSSMESGAEGITEAAPTYQEKAGTLMEAAASGIEQGAEKITDAVSTAVQAGADAIGEKEDAYNQAGAALGEAVSTGLQESLSSDDSSLILNPESISSKSQEYEAAGQALGEAVSLGLSSKQQEINEALTPSTESLAGKSGEYQAAGQLLGQAFSTGLSSTQQNSDTAGQTIGQSGAKGAESQQSSFRAAGQTAGTSYASGVSSGSGAAASAGSSIASSAASGASSHSGSFYSAGLNAAYGLASGINAGASAAINAAISVAVAALAAAKNALGIRSPSRKFRDEVGKHVGEGFAFGIKDSASLAGKEAEKMSKDVFNKATAWLTKYKKKQKASLEDQKYYWQQVIKHVKKGTKEYEKAQEKISKVESAQLQKAAKSKFNASWTKKGSSEKKSAEDYYSEILSAAQKYVSNYKIINNISLKQEREYWIEVRKTLKSGTQAWYDATAKIKELKVEIKEETIQAYDDIVSAGEAYIRKREILGKMDNQSELKYWKNKLKTIEDMGGKYSDAWYDIKEKINEITAEINEAKENAQQEKLSTRKNVYDSLLSTYQTYYNVSLRAEAQYWYRAGKKFKQGTAERVYADQKLYEARKTYFDKLKELDQDYVDSTNEVNDQLKENIQDLMDEYEDAVESRADSIKSSFGLFDVFSSESESGQKLLYNLKTQVAGIADWERELSILGARGISEGLLEELKEMGPQAAASIQALNTLTASELAEYNELWNQRNELAMSQAVIDSEPVRRETQEKIEQAKKEAQAELDSLKAAYEKNVAEISQGISKELEDLIQKAVNVGEDAVVGLVTGLNKAIETDPVKVRIKDGAVETISEELGQLEPAGKIIGTDTINAILDGMNNQELIEQKSKTLFEQMRQLYTEEAQMVSEVYLNGLKQSLASAQRATANLNQSMNFAANYNPIMNVNNQTLEQELGELITLSATYFPQIVESNSIVLDKQKVSQALSPSISRTMAEAMKYQR